MSTVKPINKALQSEVVTLVNNYIVQAEDLYNERFEFIPVLFDLTGRSAGMYKISQGKKVIRFNPYHFAKYFKVNMEETVPHEVAHYITDKMYGLRHIRPHGKEWKAVMIKFGVEPKRTFSYSLEGIPTRNHSKYTYTCDCMQFEITTRRHNKIQKGMAEYSCRQCGEKIKYFNNVVQKDSYVL